MDHLSRLKVTDAGFTILRADLFYPTKIQCMRKGSRRFETWQDYLTKDERDKRLRELLKNKNFIID